MTRKTIDQLLAEARRDLRRLEPLEAHEAVIEGALLVDMRTAEQVAADGEIPGAVWIPRNVLEWRLDPGSGHRHDAVRGLDQHVILICAQGYSSSLAAATLQELGFERATDVVGGFDSWRAAGLPVRQAGPE